MLFDNKFRVLKYLIVFILVTFLLWNILIRTNYKMAPSTFPHEKHHSIPNDVTFQEMKRNKALKRFGNRRNCSEATSPNAACVDTACNSTLPPATSDVNFWNVFKPLTRVKDVSVRLSEAMGPYRSASEVIFVTAASSNHFKESQALMKNLHQTVFPHLKNYTFYFYDLGLTSKQRQQVIHQLAQSLYGDKIVVVLV
ncbi:uncharacterized protein LOC121389657 isoform X3 [Gigantopelta aegis]|uniref:uncharacterized protein LOC121389657 isoform X3 n=1 Tax=Gigantopelta aegis TaxID=1735272 RepID=UPI001B88CC1D|nr:uncharacterized protein LOC121389657 isoform X3 [Gigantopelta aegis]